MARVSDQAANECEVMDLLLGGDVTAQETRVADDPPQKRCNKINKAHDASFDSFPKHKLSLEKYTTDTVTR